MDKVMVFEKEVVWVEKGRFVKVFFIYSGDL